MITSKPDDGGLTITITAQIDLNSAEEARALLMAAINENDRPVRLDLTDGPATVPALQLVLAARRTLQGAERFAGFGPVAAVQLVPPDESAAEPSFASVRAAA